MVSSVKVVNSPAAHHRGFGRWAFSAVGAAMIAVLLSACSPSGETDPVHLLSGEIIEVDADAGKLLVEHGDIPGLLEAGATAFRVSRGDLANAKAGQRVRARVVESGGEKRLEQIWPDDRLSRGIIDQTTLALRQDTMTRGSRAFREVGEEAPAFALFNQDGEVVRINRYRGKALVVNFIYTRCPVPHMCPAATMRMAQLQEEARDAGIEDFELISITLDPDFDTPGVLREYADRYDIDTENFSFLTGPQNAINDLMAQMGIIIEGDVSNHTLGTALIDPAGTIRHRVFGSNWMVSDFLERLKALQEEPT